MYLKKKAQNMKIFHFYICFYKQGICYTLVTSILADSKPNHALSGMEGSLCTVSLGSLPGTVRNLPGILTHLHFERGGGLGDASVHVMRLLCIHSHLLHSLHCAIGISTESEIENLDTAHGIVGKPDPQTTYID